MTTKLYFSASPPPPPELDLSAGVHSSAVLTLPNDIRLLRGCLSPDAPTGTAHRLRGVTAAETTRQDIPIYQGVSGPYEAWNVAAGNWNLEVYTKESDAAANIFLDVSLFFIQADGTIIELWPAGEPPLDIEWSAAGLAKRSGSVTPGAVNDAEGGRFLVEVYMRATQSAVDQLMGTIMLDDPAHPSFLEIPGDVSFVADRTRDFTVYDAYLDTLGVLYHEDDGSHPETQTLPLRPVRQDAGGNPFELRPEYGDFFAQGDFSHGSGQRYFHRDGRDSKKYLVSEGYDIATPGRLVHLWEMAADAGVGPTANGWLEIVGGLPFAGIGTNVARGDGNFPGVWTNENPHAGDGATSVIDGAAAGDELYVMLASGHVHKRDAAGAWTHVADLSAGGTGRKLARVKDRLIAVTGRTVYELVAAVGRALETLEVGWLVRDIGESGDYVYLAATNGAAGLSRIHHYGLDDTGTIVKKGSTPMPRGQMARSVQGYLGVVYVGAGKENTAGGYDPILYQGTPDAAGNLQFLKVAEQEGSGALDLSCSAILPRGEDVLVGWSLATPAMPAGAGPRTGLAVHHLARDAFAHHVQVPTGTISPTRVSSIAVYKGRVLFIVSGVGLFFENIDTYVPEAFLISSLGDWSNAGLKTWDLFELNHAPIPSESETCIVYLDYSVDEPENAAWIGVLLSEEAGSTGPGATRLLISSRTLAVRLRSVSSPSQQTAPAIVGFSVRSSPRPQDVEFVLVRFLRLLPSDRKDENAEPVYVADVEATRAAIMDLAYTWLPLYEPDATWLVHVETVDDVQPSEPMLVGTQGDSSREGYLLKLTMIGTRSDP